MSARRVHCKLHCSCCGRHFSSLKAFDAHRVGEFSAPDARRCVDPAELELLAPKTHDGLCDLCSLEPCAGVTVFAYAADLVDAVVRPRFRDALAAAGSASEPTGVPEATEALPEGVSGANCLPADTASRVG